MATRHAMLSTYCINTYIQTYKHIKTHTCGVTPVQENPNKPCVNQHLPGKCHVWLELAQNLHTGPQIKSFG